MIGCQVADQHVAIVRLDRRPRERLEFLERVRVSDTDMGDEIAFGYGGSPFGLGKMK